MKSVVLFNPQFGSLHVLVDVESGMLKRFLGAGHGTTINRHEEFPSLGRLDHPADMATDSSQAEVSADPTLRQLDGRLVRDLAHVGAASTRKYQNLIRFAKTFLIHFVSPI